MPAHAALIVPEMKGFVRSAFKLQDLSEKSNPKA
jgi:hypothetical protein